LYFVYFLYFQTCTCFLTIIQLKYFGKKKKNSTFPLQEVSKFAEVLRQNHIPLSSGLFVTTSRFLPRCQHVGIKLIDGQQLAALEARAHYAVIYGAIKWILAGVLAATAYLCYTGELDASGAQAWAEQQWAEAQKWARDAWRRLRG